MITYDGMAAEIYAQNKAVGWWDNPDRCIYETLQLVSTEIAEATEGERKNLMDDHLPTRKMGEVELADALIRILDLGGRYGWEYDRIITANRESTSPGYTVGAKHLFINIELMRLAQHIQTTNPEDGLNGYLYSRVINAIVATADSQGYDVEAAMLEKLEYNKNRADHKRENRAGEHGKKF